MSLNLDPRQRAMLAELGVHVWWPQQAAALASDTSALAPAVSQNAIDSEAGSADVSRARGQNHINSSGADGNPARAVASGYTPSATAPVGVVPADTAATTQPHDTRQQTPASANRQPPPRRVAALSAGPASLLPLPDGIASMDWPALSAAVANCQACPMCLGRQAAVFVPPAADLRCDWLVLGEPPDDAQERAGQPFVDEAGKLLDNMLKAVGVTRCQPADVSAAPPASATAAPSDAASVSLPLPAQLAYLSHVLKCRPARPTASDAAALAACAHYLQREIALVQPKVIVAMGRFAMQVLLGQDHPDGLTLPLGKLRGRVWHYQGVPVVVTYPPAYLLRHGLDKARAWADLCLALDVVQGKVQELVQPG